MMIEPSITNLMKKFDSRYTLVIAVAKRAREISAVDGQLAKPVTEAVVEVAEGKVHVIKAPEEIEMPDEITYVDYVEPTEEERNF